MKKNLNKINNVSYEEYLEIVLRNIHNSHIFRIYEGNWNRAKLQVLRELDKKDYELYYFYDDKQRAYYYAVVTKKEFKGNITNV